MRADIARALREEGMMLLRAGWTYHPPVLDENGKFLLGFPEYDAFLGVAKRFFDAGARIFLTNLPVGWIDEGVCDFTSMDETLSRLFSALPEAYYIPRLRLDPPFSWMEKHPEELCVFEGEATDNESISAAVRLGRVNNTYDMTRPSNPNGLKPLRLDEPIGLQSFTSLLWLQDAEAALEKAILHLQDSPYANRIIGLHICFGGTCELLHWGNGGGRIGDFSIKHTEAFCRWALDKYGSYREIGRAWGREISSSFDVQVPPKAVRLEKPRDAEALYRMDGNGCYVRDYELFHSESVANAFLRLAKRAKTLAPSLAIGGFYGYEGYGHEHLDKMLSSPYVDYFSAPKPYADPSAGGRGGSVAKVGSFMHKKLWIEELDNRPHTAWDPRQYASHIDVSPAANLAESANVLWREVCKLEADGASWWWMDQGDAHHLWYDDDGLMQIIAEQIKVHKALRRKPAGDICRVALVSDTAANYYGGIRNALPVRAQMLASGIPFRELRMSDLDTLDLSSYRLLIFTQPMRLTEQAICAVEARLSAGAQVLFTDLPCACEGAFFSPSRAEVILGAKIVENTSDFLAEAPIRLASREPFCRNGNRWLCIDHTAFQSTLLRAASACGVVPYAPTGTVVHGNEALFGLFVMRDSGFSAEIRLPKKDDWFEWFTKTRYYGVDSLSLSLSQKEARVFFSRALCEELGIEL